MLAPEHQFHVLFNEVGSITDTPYVNVFIVESQVVFCYHQLSLLIVWNIEFCCIEELGNILVDIQV